MAVRRSLSLTVMLGVSAIACGVLATISLVQYRETRAALASVQEEEGRQLATTLATAVAAIIDDGTSAPRFEQHPARMLATRASLLAESSAGAEPGDRVAGGNELAQLGWAVDAMAKQIEVDGARLEAGAVRYREVVESAGDGIFTANRSGP